jgi:K+-transporting ATPase ATPase C chain
MTMGNDLRAAIRPSIVMLILFTLLTGLAYPALLTGIAQAVFPHQANGSLVRNGDAVVGSELIGQVFAAPKYFHGRPSAAGKGYDATASGGSNLGPASKALIDRVKGDIKAVRADGLTGPIPADMVTASASGLDPDVSPETAYAQVARVAKARGIAEGVVKAMVYGAVAEPILGVLGERRVNVLMLNRQLDAAGAKPPA